MKLGKVPSKIWVTLAYKAIKVIIDKESKFIFQVVVKKGHDAHHEQGSTEHACWPAYEEDFLGSNQLGWWVQGQSTWCISRNRGQKIRVIWYILEINVLAPNPLLGLQWLSFHFCIKLSSQPPPAMQQVGGCSACQSSRSSTVTLVDCHRCSCFDGSAFLMFSVTGGDSAVCFTSFM